jgi:Enoyl-CoA hydratase/isomerase
MSEVEYEVTGRIARVTLNRPARGNGITRGLVTELERCVERADLDPAVRMLLLAGNGKGFCGGYDLVESAEGQGGPAGPDHAARPPAGSPLDSVVMAANQGTTRLTSPIRSASAASTGVRARDADCLGRVDLPRCGDGRGAVVSRPGRASGRRRAAGDHGRAKLGLRISRRQWIGICLTAVGLILLAFSLPAVHGAHSRFSVPGMIAFEAGLLLAGTLLIMSRRLGASKAHHGFMLGAAFGILFGVSDVAIKAISGMIGAHGVLGLVSPWTVVTAVAPVAAFYSSAKGLEDGDAVPVIAITGTAANVSGIVGGIIVFGDPLSAHPLALVVECLAFALVLVAAWLTPAPVRAAGVVAGPGLIGTPA